MDKNDYETVLKETKKFLDKKLKINIISLIVMLGVEQTPKSYIFFLKEYPYNFGYSITWIFFLLILWFSTKKVLLWKPC